MHEHFGFFAESDDPVPTPRLRRPFRDQMIIRPCSIDELIDDDLDALLV